MDNYSEGLASGLAIGRDNNGYGYGMGGFGWEWIWIIILFAFWGNGGWGFGNGGNSGALTREQACIDNNFQNLMRETAQISDAVQLGFSGLNSTICAQQYDTAQMINAMNVTNLQSTNAIQAQLANCCCTIERGLDRLSCEGATNTGAIIAAGQANTQRILDYLCNEKIEALRAENTLLTSQLSQNAQTRTIIDTLLPVAKPAYITCSPYVSAFGYPYGTSGYGFGNGSGCGCGC